MGETPTRTLAQLEREKEELEAIKEKQERRVTELEKKIIELANFYVVFQGVILTAISQAQKLQCNDWWIPFFLSLAASITNFIALGHTIPKYLKARKEFELDRSIAEEKRREIEDFKRSGFPNSTQPNVQRARNDNARFSSRMAYMTLLALLIFGFGIVMLVACLRILCHPS